MMQFKPLEPHVCVLYLRKGATLSNEAGDQFKVAGDKLEVIDTNGHTSIHDLIDGLISVSHGKNSWANIGVQITSE